MEASEPPLPEAPTNAPPGSEEKIAELARRVERGEALWHPGDCTSGQGGRRNRAQHVIPHLRAIKWKRGAWVVSFQHGGRRIHVGAFREYDEAVRALESAKREADNSAG